MSQQFNDKSSPWPHAITAVAFDMDGLMFDTEPLYYEVGVELLGRRGHEFSMNLQQQMMGRPAPDAIRILIDRFNLTDSVDTLIAECDEIYAGKIAGGLPVMPGLFALMDLLDARRIPYAVATSSKRRFADQMLSMFDLPPRLQFILTGDDIENGKPAPDMYQKAAKQFDIAPSEMLVLEDSGNGCLAAVRSGACAVAVPGTHSEDHDFSGAHLVASSLEDERLLELLNAPS